MDFFMDLDGVLADFNAAVIRICGASPKELKVGKMWGQLSRTHDFYATLDWMEDGEVLWDFVKGFEPTILTGVPWGKWAPGQKRRWCGNKLGWHVPVITCWATEKQNYGKPGDILVDDNERNIRNWKDMGGIGIYHTSAAESIREMKEILHAQGYSNEAD